MLLAFKTIMMLSILVAALCFGQNIIYYLLSYNELSVKNKLLTLLFPLLLIHPNFHSKNNKKMAKLNFIIGSFGLFIGAFIVAIMNIFSLV